MPSGSQTPEMKEYRTDLGTFDLFGLINKQLILWTYPTGMTFEKLKPMTNALKEKYYYQGGWNKNAADGVGRTVSPLVGIYEGQFVNGLAKGWGSVIDKKLNHYEGYLMMDGTTSRILCNGEGTLMLGEESIKGRN